MKNKILKICLMFVFCLVIIKVSVYAANLNVNLSSTTVEQGKTFTVSVNSGLKLTDFEVSVSSTSLTNSSITANYSGSTKYTSGTKQTILYVQQAAQKDKSKINSGTNLATIKYTVPNSQILGNATISITLKGIDSNGNKVQESTNKTVTITAPKSTNNNLATLTVNGNSVKNFKSGTTTYTLDTVENTVTSITLAATAADSKATVSGTGAKDLKVGKNTFKITVKAENGATKTYTLYITRKDVDKSKNNNLSTLKVDGKDVANFSANTTSYTLANVENSVKSINISATAVDNKAAVSGTGTKTLLEGKNTFKVTVKAESGATKVYTIVVTRKASEKTSTNNNNQTNTKKSSNCNLSSITVNGIKLSEFNTKNTTYTLSAVENDVNSIAIEPILEDSKAKVEVTGNTNLQVGENKIEIKVTAEDGTIKTYTLNVIRKDDNSEEVISPVVEPKNESKIPVNDNKIKDNTTDTMMYVYIVCAIVGLAIVIIIVKFIKDRK